MNIYLCPSPDLYHRYHREGSTVIVTDIFRATTTIVTAIANGAVGILPVATTEEAQCIGEAEDYLIAAERQVRRCAFAHLGNDPLEYRPDLVAGRRIVMTTTNGTRSMHIARQAGARLILAGSMRNLPSTIAYCHGLGSAEIVIIAAGWQGQVSTEDCLYAGAFATMVEEMGLGSAQGDATSMMADLWRAHCISPDARLRYIERSEHYARLVQAGYADAVEYCMQIGGADVVVGSSDEQDGWLTAL